MATRLLEWTILGCFPAGVFLLMGLLEVPTFLDPCHAWCEGSAGVPPVRAQENCLGHTSSAETRMQAVTRLVLFQGTTFIGVLAGLVGAARRQRLLLWVGSGLLVAIGLLMIGNVRLVLPLMSGILFGLGAVLFYEPGARRSVGPRDPR